MREKLDDDDDDVYKELVYISKRCFCVALCVFVSSNKLFFSQLFRDEINVEFKFRVLGFRVLFETLNFLYLSLSSKFKSARLFRRETRAVFLATFEEFAASFEERRQTKVFLSLKLHSLKEKPPDFSLNRYTFLSQHVRRL